MVTPFSNPAQTPSNLPNPFTPAAGKTSISSGQRGFLGSALGTPGATTGTSAAASNPFTVNHTAPSSAFGQPQGKSNGAKTPFSKGAFGAASTHLSAPTPSATNQLLKPRDRQSRSARRASSSSAHPDNDGGFAPAKHSKDPHARKVFQQLRRDGIAPPRWPSNPGDPKSKAEMAKFREQYEAYRDKVRASLTKAGLIDDPDKRKTLSDAIEFKGICEDMCPEFEKIYRITEFDIHQPEKNPATSLADTKKMIKKLARSAAGQEAPLPMDVRSIATLRKTLDYLIDRLLETDDRLPGLHGFLWDRTRAIRRDFTFFSSLNSVELKLQVYVLENIARFHVTALHLLAQDGKAPEDFVEQQELEQLGKALLSLRDVYDDCNAQNLSCENEAEFRAYYLIFHANDPNILETLQRQWRPSFWKDSDEVRTAVCLVEALQNTQDFHGPLKSAPSLAAATGYGAFFRIIEDPNVSYTMACFAECHFPQLRRSMLRAINKALARPKGAARDFSAATLNRFLRFDQVQQAIDFAELLGLTFTPENTFGDPGERLLILDSRQQLLHPRLQHQFSLNMVEKKRGKRPLPTVIHQTVFENGSSRAATTAPLQQDNEESLFVPESKPAVASDRASLATAPVFPNPWATSNTHGNQGNDSAAPLFKTQPEQAVTATVPQSNPFLPLPQTGSTEASNPFAAPGNNPFSAPSGNTGAPLPNSQGFGPSKPSAATENEPPSQSAPATSVLTQQPQTWPSNPFAPRQNNPFSHTKLSTEAATAPAVAAVKPKASVPQNHASATQPVFQPQGGSAGSQGLLKLESDIPSALAAPSASNAFHGAKPSLLPTSDLGLQSQAAVPSAQAGSEAAAPDVPLSANATNLPVPVGASDKPTPTFEMSGQNRKAPSFPSNSPAVTEPDKSKRTTTPETSPTTAKMPVPFTEAPRDILADFTRWFVKGDHGLLEDFEVFMVENMIKDIYDKFVREQEEAARLEEERKDHEKAQQFRTRALSLRYFYRWKECARRKRLRSLRQSGRDQMRAFHEAQRAAAAREKQRAVLRLKKRQQQQQEIQAQPKNQSDELVEVIRQNRLQRQTSEKVPLTSDALAKRFGSNKTNAITMTRSVRSPSVSTTTSRGGSKTRALRDELLGAVNPHGFRRSLPSMASRDSRSPDYSRAASPSARKVSERWRLKAMGIVQMPDGTAVPESLASDPRFNSRRVVSGERGRQMHRSTALSRQPSAASMIMPPPPPNVRYNHRERSHSISKTMDQQDVMVVDGPASPQKRKRSVDEEIEQRLSGDEKSHKRVLSEAQKLISEMKAMREEMEEGTTWFKDQNERILQGDLTSTRASTPWLMEDDT